MVNGAYLVIEPCKTNILALRSDQPLPSMLSRVKRYYLNFFFQRTVKIMLKAVHCIKSKSNTDHVSVWLEAGPD